MNPLRIIFAGSGEFGLPALTELIASSHDVALVVSQPDRPAGRGRGLTPTPVARAAQANYIPLLRTEDLNKESLPPADLMIVIAFGQKIGEAVVRHCRLGSINLHASLLPRYRGAAPINWAIINGETVTGNSVIRLAKRMDAGAILAQSSTPIGQLETAGELHDRLSMEGAAIIHQVLEALAADSATETPQDESKATLAPKISRGLAKLDFTRPAAEIACQVRGLYPWPGCRVRLCDAAGAEKGRMRLARARPAPDEGSRWKAGEIMSNGDIHCGSGAIEIIELQPEGRTSMALADYRRGRPWHAGLHLESVE